MQRSYWPIPAVILAVAAVAPGANAAPFCVQTQAIPPQCLYFDATSCDAAAKKMNGYCSINERELHVAGGVGHFCMVSSTLVSNCVYPDDASCEADARHNNGVCVEQPTRAESPPPDPYRSIRPLTVGAGAH